MLRGQETTVNFGCFAVVTWETDDIYDTKYENRQGQMARVGCNNSVIETRNVCALCISVHRL